MKELEKYTNPLTPSSQFPMCGNCFRVDTYKGCTFGCKYCFANNRGGKNVFDSKISDIRLIRKWFKSAIDDGDVSNIKKEFLNHRVPLHLGGLSDPFQALEWKYGATYEFLKLTKEYNYPVNISTKTSHLPDKYFDVLDPSIHTFSLSIMGYSDEYIKKWESNTPTAKERIAFARYLKSRGFWVSIRIQPLIEMDEVIELIKHTEDFVDYYTVEHLKLPKDNLKKLVELFGNLDISTPLISRGYDYEFSNDVKLNNIKKLKSITKVKIGCGDNDLHIYSDSLNCCGIDTMPEAFKNWFKYNSMYIKMTGDRSQWCPQSDCSSCLNGDCVRKDFKTMKDYVERYYRELYGDDSQVGLF